MMLMMIMTMMMGAPGPRLSAANFAKFRGAICEIQRNSATLLSANILHFGTSMRCYIN